MAMRHHVGIPQSRPDSPLQKQKIGSQCNFFAIRGPFPTKKSWDRTAIQLITWYFASQSAIGKL